MRLYQIKSTVSRSWYFEGARGGSVDDKNGGGVFEEHGERPRENAAYGGSGQKRKWLEIKNTAVRGEFDAIPSKIYIQHSRNLRLSAEQKERSESEGGFGVRSTDGPSTRHRKVA